MSIRRPPLGALALLTLGLVLGGCSIGNQHFYGLEPTYQAPIDRVVYRLARAWEQDAQRVDGSDEHSLLTELQRDQLDEILAEAGVSDPQDRSCAVTEFVASLVREHPRQAEGAEEATGAGLEQLFKDGRLSRLRVRSGQLFVLPVDTLCEWRELPAHEALIRLQKDAQGSKDIGLDASDQLVISFPSGHHVSHFQSGVLRLRDADGYRFQTLALGDLQGVRGRRAALIRLTHTMSFGDSGVAYVDRAPIPAGDSLARALESLRTLPELSFRPIDAEFALHAIAPSLNPDGGAPPIKPGMPLTLLANRLYMGRIGEVLGDAWLVDRLDTGEIAVVVTVTEGGGDPQPFLAFYHDSMSRKTFVPSLGAVLYSTESWSGDPLTIKLQVFDLDAGENTFFSSLLGTAAEAVASVRPEARAAAGVAGAIGDLLVSQNSDNEILRFEFTFVHDPGENGSTRDVLRPFDRSYIVLRPNRTKQRVPPEDVHINDQWRAQLEEDADSGGRGLDPKDSYFTFTVSSTVQVPAALMAKRQQALQAFIDSGQMQNLDDTDRLAAARRAAASVVSVLSYVDYHDELRELVAQEDFEGLAAVGTEIRDDGTLREDRQKLVESDRQALLQTLKRLLPGQLKGARTWDQAIADLEAWADGDDDDDDGDNGDGDGDNDNDNDNDDDDGDGGSGGGGGDEGEPRTEEPTQPPVEPAAPAKPTIIT